MRVAIVINTSWNIYNFRLGLIGSLKEAGIEVHTIAPKDAYTELLVTNGCIHTSLKMDNTGSNPFRDFGLFFRLWRIYRCIKPDMIFHFTIKPNIYGTLAASLLRIPVINNVSGLGTVFIQKNMISSLVLMLYRFAFRFPEIVFFQNRQDRQLFIDKNLIKPLRAEVLPGSGVDLSRFIPKNSKRNSQFTFLLISRLIYDKGIQEYIEAVINLKSKGIKARFQLLGAIDTHHKRGIPAEQLKKWVNNNLVEYLGTTDDVRQFIDTADCIVLPSYREGTPKTLLEAASSGKPLIATNVPGCNNVVENNYNGFLCRKQDARDLAHKMHKMYLLNDQGLQIMGLNSRKKVEKNFDEKIVINKYLESLEKYRKPFKDQ